MKRLSKILCSAVLLSFCAIGLVGCGYSSSPGMVVETKEYPLSDKAKLIVTRNLDDWRTGSLFTFEWYVVKCKRGNGPETTLMQDMVPRGFFANEIPQERIKITDGKIGYVFFTEIVVFDKLCNQISYFAPSDTYVAHLTEYPRDDNIASANIETSGRGYASMAWKLENGSKQNITFQTTDSGVHWNLPNSDMDVREEIKVGGAELWGKTNTSVASLQEIIEKLEHSEYVVEAHKLVLRPQAVASTSTTLGHGNEFKILKNGFDIAIVFDGWRIDDGNSVIIVDNKEYYEIVIGNPSSLRVNSSDNVYAEKVLINKKAPVLRKWLSEN